MSIYIYIYIYISSFSPKVVFHRELTPSLVTGIFSLILSTTFFKLQ